MPSPRWTLDAAPGVPVEGGIISSSAIAEIRARFWLTRTENNPEAWEALHVCSDALLQGDMGLAGTVVSSAGLRVGGRAGLGEVWDARGRLYRVPRYCWQTPTNVVSDAVAAAAAGPRVSEHVGPAESWRVVFRLSPSALNDEQDVALSVPSSTTAKSLRERLSEHLTSGAEDQPPEAEHASRNQWKGHGLPPAWQTIVFSGRVLDDAQHLQGAEARDGSILQVFVRPPAGTAPVNGFSARAGGAAAASASSARR